MQNQLFALNVQYITKLFTHIPSGVISFTEMQLLMIPFNFVLLVNDEHFFYIQYGKRILGDKTHIRIRINFLTNQCLNYYYFKLIHPLFSLGRFFFPSK